MNVGYRYRFVVVMMMNEEVLYCMFLVTQERQLHTQESYTWLDTVCLCCIFVFLCTIDFFFYCMNSVLSLAFIAWYLFSWWLNWYRKLEACCVKREVNLWVAHFIVCFSPPFSLYIIFILIFPTLSLNTTPSEYITVLPYTIVIHKVCLTLMNIGITLL